MSDKARALTKKQMENLKKRLLEEKHSLAINEQASSVDISLAAPVGSDEVEQAISDYTNSHLLRFRNRESFYAKKIDKALKKIELNEYGMCTDCGCWIRYERLMARPTADLCIVCKEESERDEHTNFISRQSKSYSKTVDLSGMMA